MILVVWCDDAVSSISSSGVSSCSCTDSST